MFNKVMLIGNLTRDVEIKFTQSGTAISKTSIAVTQKFRENKEEVLFIDLTFFGSIAENAHKYLKKGSKIHIEGKLLFEQWITPNGEKRHKHSITVQSIEMLDTKQSNVS